MTWNLCRACEALGVLWGCHVVLVGDSNVMNDDLEMAMV